jgi:hypothetical protein
VLVTTQPANRALERFARTVAFVFAGFHISAVVTMGAGDDIRRRARPVFGFYADTLRMTPGWGMFSKPPAAAHYRIEVVDDRGRIHLLATTKAQGKPALERVRDVRLRKLLTRMGSKKTRRKLGPSILDGSCRAASLEGRNAARVQVVKQTTQRKGGRPRGERRSRFEVVLERACAGADRGGAGPSARAAAHGDDA